MHLSLIHISLKIVKTSSDGKVKGFAFRVTGANGYDMTFETDKNGEIVIEGLRIGEYTVSEVANNASAAYTTPADQNVTIKLDETAVVKMHNELRDTPKTGDDTNMKLWYVLAGLDVYKRQTRQSVCESYSTRATLQQKQSTLLCLRKMCIRDSVQPAAVAD